MSSKPTPETWRAKIVAAAVIGAVGGAVRAVVSWLLDRFVSQS